MADKQNGTGARGNSKERPKGQGGSERGNHTKSSTDNRSQQVKRDNKSDNKNQRLSN